MENTGKSKEYGETKHKVNLLVATNKNERIGKTIYRGATKINKGGWI